MFILHTSNRTENLFEHLSYVLQTPLSSVFAQEVFLIQSQGMERWLAQHLTERFGVFGHFSFLFPRRFFADITDQLDLELSLTGDELKQSSREALVWQIERLLRSIQGDEFSTINHYLSDDFSSVRRFQLAQQLAFVFDNYQIMRPDWLDQWGQGNHVSQNSTEVWQKKLWQELSSNDDFVSAGKVWLSIIEQLRLNLEDEVKFAQIKALLPERISVFGINTLSPLFLEMLAALAEYVDVHFYLLNPAGVYWADLPSKRQHIQQLFETTDELNADLPQDSINTILTPSINPLLSALGQQGRDFQALMLSQVSFEHEYSSFESHGDDQQEITLLQQVQDDILANQSTQIALGYDNTIAIHACHSRLREVEVLKDQLLHRLETHPELSLRDVVIMAPDIQDYAPYVRAVFDDIPHAVADQSMRDSNRVLDRLILFLRLTRSKLVWSEVLDILDDPMVYGRYGLEYNDLDQIRHWVQDTNIRWGYSAEHRDALGAGSFQGNSWEAGLERLFMGYAIGSDDAFVDHVLPYSDIEGSSAQALGGFYDFYQLMLNITHRIEQPRRLTKWVEFTQGVMSDLFSEDSEYDYEKQEVFEQFDALKQLDQWHGESVDIDVFINWLENAAAEKKAVTGFLRGQLTFCSMLPMRAIPFKVIALLGMSEGIFPHVDTAPAFDLMADKPRLGDRSRRADERYEFLEVLLSAREHLLITYVGQSITTNDELPPSVVVSELLDLCEDVYGVGEDQLITRHPLQPFNKQYFVPNHHLYSYSRENLEIARYFSQQDREPPEVWWQGSLAHTPDLLDSEVSDDQIPMIIQLDDLFRFYRHPQQYFVRNQLHLHLKQLEAMTEGHEPFTLNRLQQSKIEQSWVEWLLQEPDISDEVLYQRLMGKGNWYQGVQGRLAFDKKRDEINHFVGRIHQHQLGNKQDDLSVDLVLGRYQLIGVLPQQYSAKSGYYRHADMKGFDVMKGWLHHLIQQQVNPKSTVVINRNEDWVFSQQATASANTESQLATLLHHFEQGQYAPSPLLVSSAFDWLTRTMAPPRANSKSPLEKAQETFEKQTLYDTSFQLLYRHANIDDVINASFEQVCEKIMSPIAEAVEREKVGGKP